MVELTVGSRFWWGDDLVEVVDTSGEPSCDKCVFNDYIKKCGKVKCLPYDRHDKTMVALVKINHDEDLAPVPIQKLGISGRSMNALIHAGINTTIHLTQLTYRKLMLVRNIGRKSADEIVSKLAEMGLSLRKEEEND